MNELTWLLAALFLPLFPLSILFNRLFQGLAGPWQRVLFLLIWPQLGLWLLNVAASPPPTWLLIWALGTALLYSFRALVVRDLGIWVGFVATAIWALLWFMALTDSLLPVSWPALSLSLPLALLALLGGELERRFGAAHAGLPGGLIEAAPRLAWLFAVVLLAVIATPVFPGFFALLGLVIDISPQLPWLTLGLALVWLSWSWAGARLLQGFLVGSSDATVPDLSGMRTGLYGGGVLALGAAGLYLAGGLI